MDFPQYVDFCQRNGLRTASILSAAEHEVVRAYINANNCKGKKTFGGIHYKLAMLAKKKFEKKLP